jgi:hypothetical protein
MTMLQETDIKKFQEIYFKEYWMKISEEEAKELWEKLLILMKYILFSNNKIYV